MAQTDLLARHLATPDLAIPNPMLYNPRGRTNLSLHMPEPLEHETLPREVWDFYCQNSKP